MRGEGLEARGWRLEAWVRVRVREHVGVERVLDQRRVALLVPPR